MEFLIELILELTLEGSIEASKSNKVPKFIRYILIAFIVLFFLAVIGLIFLTGILILKENLIAGIFMFLIGVLMLIMSIIKFRKTYLLKMDNKSN